LTCRCKLELRCAFSNRIIVDYSLALYANKESFATFIIITYKSSLVARNSMESYLVHTIRHRLLILWGMVISSLVFFERGRIHGMYLGSTRVKFNKMFCNIHRHCSFISRSQVEVQCYPVASLRKVTPLQEVAFDHSQQ